MYCGLFCSQETVENDITSNEPREPQNSHNSTPSHIDIGNEIIFRGNNYRVNLNNYVLNIFLLPIKAMLWVLKLPI